MYNGLSLDQAPPIQSVLRFFATVPLFGVTFSLLLIIFPESILITSHPIAMSSLHLLALGVITMSMFGALFQMQSVLGGKPIPAPLGNAWIIHTLFAIGVISLCSGFGFGNAVLFVIASVFLGASIVYLIQLILPLLFGEIIHDTLKGMRFSLIALGITLFLGIYLAHSYANAEIGSWFETIRSLHYSFALAGWIGVLIMAVAFQVIEMFYVTNSYGTWCKRNAFTIIAMSLLAKTVLVFAWNDFDWVPDTVIGILLLGFAVTTAKRLRSRKRRVLDPSIFFWYLGITLLTISIFTYMFYLVTDAAELLMVALLGFLFFALSVIMGMLGKIIPFLIWFHLSSSGYLDAPMMHEIIPAKRSQTLFGLMCAASAFGLIGVFFTPMITLSGVFFLLLFTLLGYNIYVAIKMHRHVITSGKKFTFPE